MRRTLKLSAALSVISLVGGAFAAFWRRAY